MGPEIPGLDRVPGPRRCVQDWPAEPGGTVRDASGTAWPALEVLEPRIQAATQHARAFGADPQLADLVAGHPDERVGIAWLQAWDAVAWLVPGDTSQGALMAQVTAVDERLRTGIAERARQEGAPWTPGMEAFANSLASQGLDDPFAPEMPLVEVGARAARWRATVSSDTFLASVDALGTWAEAIARHVPGLEAEEAAHLVQVHRALLDDLAHNPALGDSARDLVVRLSLEEWQDPEAGVRRTAGRRLGALVAGGWRPTRTDWAVLAVLTHEVQPTLTDPRGLPLADLLVQLTEAGQPEARAHLTRLATRIGHEHEDPKTRARVWEGLRGEAWLHAVTTGYTQSAHPERGARLAEVLDAAGPGQLAGVQRGDLRDLLGVSHREARLAAMRLAARLSPGRPAATPAQGPVAGRGRR